MKDMELTPRRPGIDVRTDPARWPRNRGIGCGVGSSPSLQTRKMRVQTKGSKENDMGQISRRLIPDGQQATVSRWDSESKVWPCGAEQITQ
jgi:hypothetical protein